MTDYYCENCEFFEDKSTDKLIDGYCKKYNQSLNFYDWWEKCDNCVIETLKAENAALKERLEKSVELPKPFIEQDSDGYYRVYSSRINIIRYAKQHGVYDTPEAAEARLKKLKGGEE